QSNIERRRLTVECRERLSRHIQGRLGIPIKPSEVRLHPNAADPYTWKILPEKEHLLSSAFSKNISEHSIGVYRLLCEGVGVTFEAVPSKVPNRDGPDSLVSVRNYSISGAPQINKRYSFNVQKSASLPRLTKSTEKMLSSLRNYLKQVCQLHISQRQLQSQVRSYAASADYFRGIVLQCFQGLDEVILVLEKVKTGVFLEGPEMLRHHAIPIHCSITCHDISIAITQPCS
ncbi:hypothetical protein BU26DRAFT_443106, partial [Trematosphaeria pertusa]